MKTLGKRVFVILLSLTMLFQNVSAIAAEDDMNAWNCQEKCSRINSLNF